MGGAGGGTMHGRSCLMKTGLFRKRFGNLVEVRGDKYAMLIDNSPPGVILIIHIYSEVCCITYTSYTSI